MPLISHLAILIVILFLQHSHYFCADALFLLASLFTYLIVVRVKLFHALIHSI